MKSMKVCYSITERGGRSFWTRIGVAFQNNDGSLNVILNCLPIDGKMQIRDYVPRSEPESGAKAPSGNRGFYRPFPDPEPEDPGDFPDGFDEDDIPF